MCSSPTQYSRQRGQIALRRMMVACTAVQHVAPSAAHPDSNFKQPCGIARGLAGAADTSLLPSLRQSEGGGDGNYIVSGGPFSGPIISIWSRPTVGTPSMDQGEFLVGVFKDGAQIFDRWDAQVLVSTENEDDFVKNLATILAEERLALAVKRPQAFVAGSFGAIT